MAEHPTLEKLSSMAPMLPPDLDYPSELRKDSSKPSPNAQPIGKLLLREDTYLGKLGGGCTGCNGVKVTCAGVRHTGALCWGRYSEKRFAWLLTGLTIVFLLSMAGTIVFCFTNFFDNSIKANLAIVNNSKAFDMWRNPPVNPITKIHIFNYTNVDDYMRNIASKLKVEQIGPYTYSEAIERINITFNEDGTVSYREKRIFTFLPHLSKGKEFDKVVLPNLPYLSAVSMARDSYYVTRVGLNALLKSLESKPFVNLPVHRYIWGYDDPLVNLAKSFLAFKGETPPKLGVLANRNGTSKDLFTVDTGEKDINNLGIIRSVNNIKKMTHWSTEYCNSIEATDGTMFPPNLIENKKMIYIFNSDICRRLPFEYKKDVEVWDGIPAFRYGHPDNIFDSPIQNPENQCYCHLDSGVCPPKGLFNASPCAYGAPVFASFPHFYLGDPDLVDSIEGIKPNKSIHDSHLDIHPTLGFPLGGMSRMQLNVLVRKAGGITDFLKDGQVLPVTWMEITVLELPTFIRTLVYHGTYSTAAAQLVLSWGCALVFLLSGLLLVVAIRHKAARSKRHNCSMLKKENLGPVIMLGDEKVIS